MYCMGYGNEVTWYETPVAGYEMPCTGYENEMSMKFAVHRQGMKKICTVRTQIQRYEKNFTGMKLFVQGINFFDNSMKKISRYEKKFEVRKTITKV
jgi:hypothetical protein